MSIPNKIILVLLTALSLIVYSCNTTEPGNSAELKLTVEDISCTEAWIKLTTSGNNSLSVINIKADDKLVKQVNVAQSNIDSVIYIDSLLPNKEYIFSASTGSGNAAEASIRTLDTTSHDFTWETFQFGDYGSSLYDVAIINSNDIWGVGEIYLNGETDAYNAVHWDGEKWELMRIPFYTVCGQENRTYYPASSVLAFGSNNVFISMDGRQVCKIDGTKIVDVMCPPFSYSINAMWGGDSKSIYSAADNGLIGFYNGQSWKKIESGTNTHITDVWGLNSTTGTTIYCTVSSFFEPGDRKIISIRNEIADSIIWGSNKYLSGIWTNSKNFLYVCGDGVFENKRGYWNEINLPKISMNEIRGNGLNDILVVGDFGFVTHFNGSTWKIYYDIFDASYYSISMQKKTAAICGERNGKGIITFGKRN